MSFALIIATMAVGGNAAFAQSPAGCTDRIYNAQDFSLGHWDVYMDGKKIAEVIMEKKLDGCTISERWIAPEGQKGNGLGLFVYSSLVKAWHYLWTSDTGATTAFSGQITKPNEILYITEKPLENGKKRLRHWTLSLLPNGNVREFSVGTEDQGQSWTTEYDVLWVKKSAGQ